VRWGGKKSHRGKDAHVKEKETRTKERALVEGPVLPATPGGIVKKTALE
jgi:hypothetical protein